jgi:hypothetical protein
MKVGRACLVLGRRRASWPGRLRRRRTLVYATHDISAGPTPASLSAALTSAITCSCGVPPRSSVVYAAGRGLPRSSLTRAWWCIAVCRGRKPCPGGVVYLRAAQLCPGDHKKELQVSHIALGHAAAHTCAAGWPGWCHRRAQCPHPPCWPTPQCLEQSWCATETQHWWRRALPGVGWSVHAAGHNHVQPPAGEPDDRCPTTCVFVHEAPVAEPALFSSAPRTSYTEKAKCANGRKAKGTSRLPAARGRSLTRAVNLPVAREWKVSGERPAGRPAKVMHCRPSCCRACSLLRCVKGGYFEADRPMLEAAVHSWLAAYKRSCARVVNRSCRGPRARLRDAERLRLQVAQRHPPTACWSRSAGMRSRWHAARSLLLLVAAVAAASAATAPGGAASRPSGGGTTTHGRLTARTHDLLRGLGSGRRVRGAAVPKQFLYVYDVPPEFTTDIQALPVQWHPEQYDYDQARLARGAPRQSSRRAWRSAGRAAVARAPRRAAPCASSAVCAAAPGRAARPPQPRGVCPGCGADVPAHTSAHAPAHGWGGPAVGRNARVGGAQAPAGERDPHAGPRACAAVLHPSVPWALLQRPLAAVEHARRRLGHCQGLQAGADARRLLVGEVDRREERAQPARAAQALCPCAAQHTDTRGACPSFACPVRPTPSSRNAGSCAPVSVHSGGSLEGQVQRARAIAAPGRSMRGPPMHPAPARRAQATSELVRQLLTHVRAAHPHFNESNGADHVMVFSYDHARCDLAPALRLSEWGQLLSIQSYGDLTYTCARPPTRGTTRLAARWCSVPVLRACLACRLSASRGSGTPLVLVSAGFHFDHARVRHRIGTYLQAIRQRST